MKGIPPRPAPPPRSPPPNWGSPHTPGREGRTLPKNTKTRHSQHEASNFGEKVFLLNLWNQKSKLKPQSALKNDLETSMKKTQMLDKRRSQNGDPKFTRNQDKPKPGPQGVLSAAPRFPWTVLWAPGCQSEYMTSLGTRITISRISRIRP